MATCTGTQIEPVKSMDAAAIELAPLPASPAASYQRQLGTADVENVREPATPPSTAVNALQKWNHPRSNMSRVFACFWSFLVVGMNDGSYGVCCSCPLALLKNCALTMYRH
jgi:hypothetical protein